MQVTPEPYKIEIHAYGEVYNISNYLENWEEIEIQLSRNGTSAVFFEMSIPFLFVEESKMIIKRIFESHSFESNVDIYIYHRQNNWMYGAPYVFNLDFSTYMEDDTRIEINSRTRTLNDFLKTNDKIKYDIPVAGIKEPIQWKFDRILLENSVEFATFNPAKNIHKRKVEIYQTTVGISVSETEIAVPDILEYKTVGANSDNTAITDGYDPYFLKVTSKEDINITLELKEIYAKVDNYDFYVSTPCEIFLTKNGYDDVIFRQPSERPPGNSPVHQIIVNDTLQLSLSNSDKLYLMLKLYPPDGKYDHEVCIPTGIIKATYLAKPETVNIDVVNPETLLQNIINKITDTENIYKATIKGLNVVASNLDMLVAAESLRGFEDAKIHTSYADFRDWLFSQGFEPYITNTSVNFVKREEAFNEGITALELNEQECAELAINVDSNYLFSGLKIGYDKQEYNNANGRFEFNGTNYYSSNIHINPNILEIISPYRADSIGMEFLAQTRLKQVTNKDSDNDLFLVNVSRGTYHFNTIKCNYQGLMNNDTYFNAKYSPLNLVKLNQSLIGISVRRLRFAGSDLSIGRVIVDNQHLDADYSIPSDVKLFEPINISFLSGNRKELPRDSYTNGLIKIIYKGKLYQGFIKSIMKNYTTNTAMEWTLYQKK